VGWFFTWAELWARSAATRLGVDNTPPVAAQRAMELLVAYVLDPLRAAVGRAVVVSSGFRSLEVNGAVGGSETSQHMAGEAADISVAGFTAQQLAALIVRLRVPFDQVIWYAPERGGHVHVSLTARRPNRGETLHAPAGGGYVAWSPA
jgi:uncharacterized protein YcbK (DUF882 family)